MKNHYYRTKTKHNEKMATPFHSFVYSELPQDQLFTLEDIQYRIAEYVVSKPFRLKDVLHKSQWSKIHSLVKDAINDLVADRIGIKEIHWSKVEKLVGK